MHTYLQHSHFLLIHNNVECKHARSTDLVYCKQSWMQIGTIHGIGWVGLDREITAFSLVAFCWDSTRFLGANWWREHQHFYCHLAHFPQLPVNIITLTRSTQRAQTSAEHGNPEDPDFGLWTPESEAWSGSPPKLYHLVLEPCPTSTKNFVKIRSQVCE